jgi:hypothetical protein
MISPTAHFVARAGQPDVQIGDLAVEVALDLLSAAAVGSARVLGGLAERTLRDVELVSA